MPPFRIKILPVDPAGFETAEPSWDWWDVDPGIKIVLAHLQAQGPGGAPGDVKRLKADASGSLLVTSGTGISGMKILDAGGTFNISGTGGIPGDNFGFGNGLEVVALPMLWAGALLDRQRSASATNLNALSGLGAALVDTPGEWAVQSNPAVGAQASAQKSAGGAGVRHVARAVSFGFSAGAALAGAATVTFSLLDAASVLKAWTFDLPAAIIASFAFASGPINVVGGTAQSMTVQSDAAHAGLRVFTNLSGFDAV